MYRTQKAVGLAHCWSISGNAAYGYRVPPIHGVLPMLDLKKSAAKIETLFHRKDVEVFARPCPVEPRHGFVESRVVRNVDELVKVWEETLAADPDGEVILMDRLSGKYSAIITARGITWGQGNDGVTGGHGDLKVVPTSPGTFDKTVLSWIGQGPKVKTEGAYLELVEDGNAMCLVQARTGPKQPDNRIKRVVQGIQVHIMEVIRPKNDDLIAWDKLLKSKMEIFGARCFLVWLPGQSLTSHFAVQALAKGMNVSVEDECPVVAGQMLNMGEVSAPILSTAHYQTLAEMLKAEQKLVFWDGARDVLFSVAILHSLSLWGGERHLLAMMARGVTIAARYSLAACLGESRHRIRCYPKLERKVPWDIICAAQVSPLHRPTRHYVFERAFSLPWSAGPVLAEAAAHDHVLPDQPRVMDHIAAGGSFKDYSTGYMGMKWEYASLKSHDLFCAVNKFVDAPCADNWGVVVGLYNEIINASHNGGYLLSKWASISSIDLAASMPSLMLGFAQAMALVWDLPMPSAKDLLKSTPDSLNTYYSDYFKHSIKGLMEKGKSFDICSDEDYPTSWTPKPTPAAKPPKDNAALEKLFAELDKAENDFVTAEKVIKAEAKKKKKVVKKAKPVDFKVLEDDHE